MHARPVRTLEIRGRAWTLRQVYRVHLAAVIVRGVRRALVSVAPGSPVKGAVRARVIPIRRPHGRRIKGAARAWVPSDWGMGVSHRPRRACVDGPPRARGRHDRPVERAHRTGGPLDAHRTRGPLDVSRRDGDHAGVPANRVPAEVNVNGLHGGEPMVRGPRICRALDPAGSQKRDGCAAECGVRHATHLTRAHWRRDDTRRGAVVAIHRARPPAVPVHVDLRP
jgi:hypothetical protein